MTVLNVLPKSLALVVIGLLSVSFSSSQEQTESYFNEEALLRHLETLSSDVFEGRLTGSNGAIKAKEYIINQFYSLKIQPFKKSYEQSFLFSKGKKDFKGTNILGYIEGTLEPNKYIVISAHYDHLGVNNGVIYNGADDNASGIGALFSFAQFFQKYPPKHSVILAAFDAEELGMQGSSYFIKNFPFSLKMIKANLNMDMISRSDKKELYVAGANVYTFLRKAVCCTESKKVNLITGHDGYDDKDSWVYASDHANFHKRGIPFLYFGVEDHEDYHEATDDFENIHPEFYTEAVKVIISVFKKIDVH
ncbi:M28 family peptidase [Seonamhaeicola aphaedonensis]|uniref:Peptidase M28-like protein n=1 Tax=Seonamhaeicola aphaedonensis TaxID=1461338 RepID=A0A3D9HLQ6_9FLAO|nr:M28 family peptidase [Seonamhaeicola aphaedonensis]RED50442.1 peptidase M28-like protein [Seonamhaeicola aphaedonensis]